MPRYRCHKVVEAMQITAIVDDDGGGSWLRNDSGVVHVNPSWMARHQPTVGGYFVRYDDGYESFSPAAAFESGYTLIDVS